MVFAWHFSELRYDINLQSLQKNKAQVNLNLLRWFLACCNTLRGIHPARLLGWLNLFAFITWNPGMPHAGEAVPAFM